MEAQQRKLPEMNEALALSLAVAALSEIGHEATGRQDFYHGAIFAQAAGYLQRMARERKTEVAPR